MGVVIELEDGYVHARAHDGLKGAEISLRQPSVGATENLLMAAATAKGETTIVGAAREPEIVDLAGLLVSMGARSRAPAAAASALRASRSCRRRAIRSSEIASRPPPMRWRRRSPAGGWSSRARGSSTSCSSRKAPGMRDAAGDSWRWARRERDGRGLKGGDVMTRPFPGFATDLQAQFMALMCRAEGVDDHGDDFRESLHACARADADGARITVHGGSALVRGVRSCEALR